MDAGVDDDAVHAVLAQPVAEERVLAALRVERADADDGRHRYPRSASGSTPRNRRWSSMSDDSSAAVVSA